MSAIFDFKKWWENKGWVVVGYKQTAVAAAEACEAAVVAHLTEPMECGHAKAEWVTRLNSKGPESEYGSYSECRSCVREQCIRDESTEAAMEIYVNLETREQRVREELTAPSPCGVEEHRAMDWVSIPDGTTARTFLCLACAREQRVAEAVLGELENKKDLFLTIGDWKNWRLVVEQVRSHLPEIIRRAHEKEER